MNTAVIELNDCDRVYFPSRRTWWRRSPGIAVLKQDRIELGQAALQSTHIDPRNTFSRFWSNLNQDNFKRRTKLARHHADLAFAHLSALHEMAGEVDEAVFAVPAVLPTVNCRCCLVWQRLLVYRNGPGGRRGCSDGCDSRGRRI